jgi:four helix bundle protein
MGVHSFEEIEAWQEARRFARLVQTYSHRATVKKDWAWADQISRAALSVMANIAEGNDAQTNTEFAMFLGYAKRSATEARSHLYYGLDNGYLSQKDFEHAFEMSRKIASQLAKLIAYLRSHPRKDRQRSPCDAPTCNVSRANVQRVNVSRNP